MHGLYTQNSQSMGAAYAGPKQRRPAAWQKHALKRTARLFCSVPDAKCAKQARTGVAGGEGARQDTTSSEHWRCHGEQKPRARKQQLCLKIQKTTKLVYKLSPNMWGKTPCHNPLFPCNESPLPSIQQGGGDGLHRSGASLGVMGAVWWGLFLLREKTEVSSAPTGVPCI